MVSVKGLSLNAVSSSKKNVFLDGPYLRAHLMDQFNFCFVGKPILCTLQKRGLFVKFEIFDYPPYPKPPLAGPKMGQIEDFGGF